MPATPRNYDLGKPDLDKPDFAARWFPGRNLVTTLRYRGRDYRYRALFSVLRRHCRGRVLDVGGGSFVTTAIEERVQFNEWTIVEPHEADLPALTDSRVRTMVGDGRALEIEGNQFDTVLSIQVLEHVFEPIRMIEELYRVTRPGGHLVVMVPQTANLHHIPHHYQNFTRYWLEAAAHRLGADVVEYHTLGGAWSTIASRVLLQYPGVFGVSGYRHPGVSRGWRFWALFPVGLLASAIVFPLSMLMSLGDMKEEANNHVMVLRKPLQQRAPRIAGVVIGGLIMANTFSHLLAPGRIGTLELRNRIFMCPMGDELCNHDGTISANQAAYFEARARGGAALLLVGSVSIAYPRSSFSDRQTAASNDSFLPGLIDLTTRVHKHGGRIAAQLVHNGQMSLLDTARGLPQLVPSVPKAAHPDKYSMMVTPEEIAAMMWPFTQPTSKLEYQVASEADIATVIEQFVDAADRCMRAGFDGIELHAGHGYLIDEFLTPSMNKRTDGWGGALDGRARLLLETIRALRKRLGEEMPLWIRINAVEHHKPDGERFEEQLKVIQMAVNEGIDAVHVTAYANTDVATGPTDGYAPHTYTPNQPGSLSMYAKVVRETVSVPVISFGRYEPDEADQVIADGKADFIAMGRKLLADPDIPNKLREGRVDDIRPCIYQYRCIGNIFVNESLHCVGNAQTGREHDLAMSPTSNPRRVLVIGGGPGGLEAARVLAGNGHAVTVWEASEQLGGMLRYAGRVDHLLDRYKGWIIRQVEQAGVTLMLGKRATVDEVRAFGADEVVVATGATWGKPSVPGTELAHVRSVPEIGSWLDGGDDHLVGQRVVLVGGGKASVSIADLCIKRGREVAIVEETNVFCGELGLPGRWRLVPDIEAAGARLVDSARIESITADAVQVRIGDKVESIQADTVIVTNAAVPDNALFTQLEAAGIAARLVGDCNGVRRLEGANLDAAEVALAIA